MASFSIPFKKGKTPSRNFKILSTTCSEKQIITKTHYIDTLIIDLPINVAPKNTPNGIKKCPHVSPAKSNKGFGIEAHNNTAIKACLFNIL